LNYITFRPDFVSASCDVTSILRTKPIIYFIKRNEKKERKKIQSWDNHEQGQVGKYIISLFFFFSVLFSLLERSNLHNLSICLVLFFLGGEFHYVLWYPYQYIDSRKQESYHENVCKFVSRSIHNQIIVK
jgi:hypothetical protein